MEIDPRNEQLFTLAEVASIVGQLHPRKKRPCVSTIWRWTRIGLGGVRLQAVRFSREYYVSEASLIRFLNEAAMTPHPHASIPLPESTPVFIPETPAPATEAAEPVQAKFRSGTVEYQREQRRKRALEAAKRLMK